MFEGDFESCFRDAVQKPRRLEPFLNWDVPNRYPLFSGAYGVTLPETNIAPENRPPQ